MMRETEVRARSGIPVLLLVHPLLIAFTVWLFIRCGLSLASGGGALSVLVLICAVLLAIWCLLMVGGYFAVAPNEARVLTLFGKYKGTVKETGLRWNNPFIVCTKLSLRVRNFDSDKLKVNDADGNPIEIGAVVVWKVTDTAEAMFHVDDYEHFVRVQSEAALRNLATHYSYDSHEDGEMALRSHTQEIASLLKTEVQDRLEQAGVEVLEARISHLAYAPEIASAMLQRQQASAIIAARQKIVEGAVGMVEMALDSLAEKSVVELDEERKATMVSNLLVVLCGDKATQPVLNTGSLYS